MKFSLANILPTKKKAGILAPIDNRGGWWPVVMESFAGAWQRNIEVKQEDLLSSPIVYACITLIANDIGKLRARLVEKDSDGIWSEIEAPSPFWPVLRRPNRYQNHIQFKQWWVTSKLRFGNSYALKERDARGIVTALYLLDPCRVTPLLTDDGGVYYQLGQDNMAGVGQVGITVPASEVIHDRMNCLYHQLVGVSPLYAAAIAAGIGIAIKRNTANFFQNNATPSGILIAPGSLSQDKARAVKEAWQSGYTGANAGKVAVLGDGMKFEPMGRNAVDSQLIETLRWSDERICSVFHVPGYKVGVGSAPSYNNIEALDRAYYSDCLQSPIEEFEACMDEGLGLDGHTKGIELDLDGLMRMDSKTQMETIAAGIGAKAYTINDARKKVGLPPLPGGDTVYMQMQDFPLEEIKKNRLAEPAPVTPAAEPVPELPAEEEIEAEETEAEKALAQSTAFIAKQSEFMKSLADKFEEREQQIVAAEAKTVEVTKALELHEFALAVNTRFAEDDG